MRFARLELNYLENLQRDAKKSRINKRFFHRSDLITLAGFKNNFFSKSNFFQLIKIAVI